MESRVQYPVSAIKMVDLSRRKFIKQTLKFSVATSAAVATFPMVSLYQEKVKPILVEKFPETNFNSDMNFIEALTPHLLIGSSIMSFIMMYADQLETFAILIIAALAMIFFGLPITDSLLNYFI